MYNIRPTTKFQKDLKRVKKRGFDISLLTDIIKKLAALQQALGVCTDGVERGDGALPVAGM